MCLACDITPNKYGFASHFIIIIMANDVQKLLRFHIVTNEMQKTAFPDSVYDKLAQREVERKICLCQNIVHISCTYE